MQTKWLFIIGIAVAVIASFYYVVQLDLGMAVLSMVALFAMTNAMRAKSFKAQGMTREARWMQILSLVFVVAFIVLFIVTVIA